MERAQELTNFLKIVGGIADKEYQRRVWIKGLGPECDDFDETVNFFFPQFSDIMKHVRELNVTKKQEHLLTVFSLTLEDFVRISMGRLPEDFIDTPEWTQITEMAQEVLKAFNWGLTKK